MAFKRHAEAEAFEYAVGAYLRACGYRTFGESLNYQQRGAPLARGDQGADSYASADISAMKNGSMSFFEVKWKSATFPNQYGRGQLTGIDADSYNAYLKHERDGGSPVVIVFCHRREREIRCATLAHLRTIESHRCTQQQYPGSKGGMVNWFFEQIPLWMPYEDLDRLAENFRQSGNAIAPPRAPIVDPIAPQPEVQVPMAMIAPAWKGDLAPQKSFLFTEVEVNDVDRGNGGRKMRRG